MENYLNKFNNKNIKFNIFLGEYTNKLLNTPTVQTISKELLSAQSREYILLNTHLSLPDMIQNFLNNSIYEKEEIISKLSNLFLLKTKENKTFYQELFDSKLVSTLISSNYDYVLEDNFSDLIKKSTPFAINDDESIKIAFYKIYGDFKEINNCALSSQELKRIKVLPFHINFWNKIRNHLLSEPTILFGVNLKDNSFIDILEFILKPIISKYQQIYIYLSKEQQRDVSIEMEKLFNKYSIKIINGENENFIKTIKNTFVEELNDLSLIKKNENSIVGIHDTVEKPEFKLIPEAFMLTDTEKEDSISLPIIEEKFEEKTIKLPFMEGLKKELNEKELVEETLEETDKTSLITKDEEITEFFEDKIELKEKKERTPKTFEIKIDENPFLETASEIKYKTLFLDKFPVKYRNFSRTLIFEKIFNLGKVEVDFGFDKIMIDSVRILDYPKFKIVEFKTREFKIGVGVISSNNIFLKSNGFFEYEITDNIKNNIRLNWVLEFFSKLFKGTYIKFHSSNVMFDIDFINNIEHFKFETLKELLYNYKDLVTNLKLYKKKNFISIDNSFYEISLLNKLNNSEAINTWINFKADNNLNILAGDSLILKRKHTLYFNNLPYNLEEKIIVLNPLNETELKDNLISLRRKTVKIELNKIDK